MALTGLVVREDEWKIVTELILDGISSSHTRRAYSQALDEFLIWFRDEPGRQFNKATVQKYRTELETKELAPSSINVRLSAIRRLALEARDNGRLDPDIAAGIARAKGAKRSGVRLGHWLTAEQAQALLATPVEIRRPLSPNGQQRCRLMWAARAPSRTFKSKSGSCKVA
jgi:site-specific recombinase XerD